MNRAPPAAALDVLPLTPERWPDLEALFGARGCSMARGCWCMAYRETPAEGRQAVAQGVAAVRKARLRALADAGPPPGLLAYRDGVAVGWVTLGPREAFARLRRSPVMKPVDDEPVWSVVCFVVPPAWRHQGVAHALLRGAVAHARDSGARWLEGYPLDKAERGADAWLWFGARSMFDAAGFVEVARRRPERPLMRLALQP